MLSSENILEPDRAEARLPRWMTGVAVAATLAMLVSGHLRQAAGFALGATLAIVNYYWLHQVIDTLFRTTRASVPKGVLLKFCLRYPLAFAGIYLVYRSRWLSMGAIFAGLFVPVAGALVEAVVQIKDGFRIQGA
jgi:ATP synthase I chain